MRHLIPETPAQRRPVTFNYEHSHPIIAGSHIIRGDRANELRIIRDAADGFIRAVKSGSREGLCSAACGALLCTRSEHDDGIHLCVEVNVVAHAIWTEAEDTSATSTFRIKSTGEHVTIATFSVDAAGTVRFQSRDPDREFEMGEVEPFDEEARRVMACVEEAVRDAALAERE